MVWEVSNFILLYVVYPVVLGPFADKLLFPYWMILTLLLKTDWSQRYRFISGLLIIVYWSLCLSLSVPHGLDCGRFVVSSEIEMCESFNFLRRFAYSVSLAIMYEFRTSFSISAKKGSRNFDINCMESVDCFIEYQFNSVGQSCPTLCDPMNRSAPGLPVHPQLPELTQTHVHWVGDAIQPSYPLSSPSPPAPNPSQHQSLFQWVNSSHEVAKVLEFQL